MCSVKEEFYYLLSQGWDYKTVMYALKDARYNLLIDRIEELKIEDKEIKEIIEGIRKLTEMHETYMKENKLKNIYFPEVSSLNLKCSQKVYYPDYVIHKLLQIMSTCDGGCYVCVGRMFDTIAEQLPELKEIANAIFKEEIGYDYVKGDWIGEITKKQIKGKKSGKGSSKEN